VVSSLGDISQVTLDPAAPVRGVHVDVVAVCNVLVVHHLMRQPHIALSLISFRCPLHAVLLSSLPGPSPSHASRDLQCKQKACMERAGAAQR
jgi:hypothetical protein